MSTAEFYGYFQREVLNPVIGWDDLARLRKLRTGPLVIKGIMTCDDARRAVDDGVDGIILSNHGGRQLDGLPATIQVLPELVDAVGSQVEILLDGGIRLSKSATYVI